MGKSMVSGVDFPKRTTSCDGMMNEVRDTRSRRVTWRIRFLRWRRGQARGPGDLVLVGTCNGSPMVGDIPAMTS